MRKQTLKSLKRKAWELQSQLVRRRSADWRGYAECYTCRAVKMWKELHCGHYIHGKGNHNEKNLKPQCNKCNTYLGGNLGKYAERLISEEGEDFVKELRREIESEKPRTMQDYRELIEDLKEKINELPHN